MSWPVRLDPAFPRHPKMLRAGPLGRELFVAALCHSNSLLTDGWLSMDELRALSQYDGVFVHDPLAVVQTRPVVEDVMEVLIAVGAFEYLDGRVHIHDFEEYQSSREDILAERARWRDQKSRQRAGFSGFQRSVSTQESEEKGLEEAVDARAMLACPVCGPMPFSTDRRLREHIENLHPELAEAVA